MTIAAAYLTSEGVVWGSDSASSVSTLVRPIAGPAVGQPTPEAPTQAPRGVAAILQVFNHAQKIFELGPTGMGRMALATWGAGRVNQTSHRTVAARLADRLAQAEAEGPQEKASVLATVEMVTKIVGDIGPTEPFGYLLGGIDLASREPALYRIFFEKGKPPAVNPLAIGQGIFEGAPELFIRAFHGADPKLVGTVRKALIERVGSKVPEMGTIFDEALNAALVSIPHGGLGDLPIREAIDFVHMYLHLTIKGMKFRFGPPTCGGPIEIGFISTDRRFRWVRHKRFDTAIYEEEVGIL